MITIEFWLLIFNSQLLTNLLNKDPFIFALKKFFFRSCF